VSEFSADQASPRRVPLPDEEAELALEQRTGLPEAWTFLTVRHPRAQWGQPGHTSGMAQFWLERHGEFREFAPALLEASEALIAGQVDPARFAAWFGPRLSFFLQSLEGHHHVEDEHYFPAFSRVEPRLARGFALLDRDHVALDGHLHALARAGDELVRVLHEGSVAPDHAKSTADVLHAFNPGLMRHLDDEEDLVIPLILTHAGAAEDD